MPVDGLENDGLLQLDFDDLAEASSNDAQATGAASHPSRREQELENELIAMRMAFEDLRKQYLGRIGLDADAGIGRGGGPAQTAKERREPPREESREQRAQEEQRAMVKRAQVGVVIHPGTDS